jgi:hypothetical protein
VVEPTMTAKRPYRHTKRLDDIDAVRARVKQLAETMSRKREHPPYRLVVTPVTLPAAREEFPKRRDVAVAIQHGPRDFEIRLAWLKFKYWSRNRQEAILRHELAHVDQYLSDYDGEGPDGAGVEVDADRFAAWCWGDAIRYDAEDVQTLGRGRLRPAHLPH